MQVFLQRATNHLKNPRYQENKDHISNELVKNQSPINIVPNYILIENFNNIDT